MPGSFVGGNEVLQHAKDLVSIPKHYKVIHLISIYYILELIMNKIFKFETKALCLIGSLMCNADT